MPLTSQRRSARAACTKAVRSFANLYNALAGSGLQDE